jgi:hypothetical protein
MLLSFLSPYSQENSRFFWFSVRSNDDNAAKPGCAFCLNVGKACAPENQKYLNGLAFRIIHKYVCMKILQCGKSAQSHDGKSLDGDKNLSWSQKPSKVVGGRSL